MSEENEPKEIEPKGSRILFCYFVVVLLLGLVAVGILFRAFDTAFVERPRARNDRTVWCCPDVAISIRRTVS